MEKNRASGVTVQLLILLSLALLLFIAPFIPAAASKQSSCSTKIGHADVREAKISMESINESKLVY